MASKLLKQEEIDALLNPQANEDLLKDPQFLAEKADQQLTGIEPIGHVLEQDEQVDGQLMDQIDMQAPSQELLDTGETAGTLDIPADTGTMVRAITTEEMDALGEVGNICMGSASTTLSMLLNQKVNITSPRVTITTRSDLFKSFDIPHMTIHVSFTEGISGYNLLIIRLSDAAVLADLMMGGDGSNITPELNEISESAASEAMNQMIGSASTAMASMFNRTVNISPPVTQVFYSSADLKPPEQTNEDTIVVVWFKLIIGNILDTHIMQVMSVDTAREQSGLILGQIYGDQPTQSYQETEYGLDSPDIKVSITQTSDPYQEAQGHIGIIQQDPAGLFKGMQEQDLGVNEAKPVFKGPSYTMEPAPETTAAADMLNIDQQRIGMILDIPLKVTVLLGRTKWPIKDILNLAMGSVVELQSLVDEPVEVLVNGSLVARGEVVVINENFGVRITSILGPEARLKNLGK